MFVFHIYIHLKNEIKPGMRNGWEWHKLKKKKEKKEKIFTYLKIYLFIIYKIRVAEKKEKAEKLFFEFYQF